MEYFFDGSLRWNYGFENPNKAAVLFACALPLAWAVWLLAWRLKRSWGRTAAVVASTILVAITAWLLFKTYSRGGMAAGVCAVAYLGLRDLRLGPAAGGRKSRGMAQVGLCILVGVIFWTTGLSDRAFQSLDGQDASVGNRLVLWQRALQMAVDRPSGFGLGQSGVTYMDWYQPLEMSAEYRTLVNSYLTALVEWGWVAFGAAFLGAAFFWGWANPRSRNSEVVGAMRGVILAFAVAGVFSTTMEDARLWILPGVSAAALFGWALIERRSIASGLPAAAGAGICLVLVGGAGWIWKERDEEKRAFRSGRTSAFVQVGPRDARADAWTVLPDPEVLGVHSGKLLRRLAKGANLRVEAGAESPLPATRLILAGNAVAGAIGKKEARQVVLLAPAAVDENQARAWLGRSDRVLIFVPDLDEDGRSEFWRSAGEGIPDVKVITVEGVGNRLDWGWEEVVSGIAKFSKDS